MPVPAQALDPVGAGSSTTPHPPRPPHRWSLRSVLAAALAVVMVVLTVALIRIAFDRFESMAHESARTLAGQQVRQGSERLAAMLSRTRNVVEVTARMGFMDPERDARQGLLERRWIVALEVNKDLRSLHLTLRDGRDFQVLALRDDADARAALAAPAGARYASRSLVPAAGDAPRHETWRFLDGAGRLLGARDTDTTMDARAAPAYAAALARDAVVLTEPAPLPTTQPLGPAHAQGITMARRLADGSGVLATDIGLGDLERLFAGLVTAPLSVTTLVDPQGRLVVGVAGEGARLAWAGQPLVALAAAGDAGLQAMAGWRSDAAPRIEVAEVDGAPVVLAQASVEMVPGEHWRVLSYAPLSGSLSLMRQARNDMALFGAVALLVALLLALLGTGRIVSGLHALAADAARIRALDFSPTPRVHSRLREIDALGAAHAVMKESIREGTQALENSRAHLEYLIAAGLAMSRERDRMGLLRQILWGARQLTHCDAATLYIVTEQRTLRFALRTRDDALPATEIALLDEQGRENTHFVSAFVALRNTPVVIDDVDADTRFDFSGTRSFDQRTGYRTVSMLALPLAPREGQVIGVLQLMNATDPASGQVTGFGEEAVRMASALAAQAAVSLDNHQLVQSQSNLVDSMVQLLAGAIDAKSPYTGGHCARVPELAFMLAEEATRVTEGPLAAFRFDTPEQWREFRIGAWLHDCGKITTPEYVVDKATKLETIYDRIHEIRTRFEVLWRDAEIDCLNAWLGGGDRAEALAARDARRARLQADFAFVAECNLGAEFMVPEHVARLRSIGAQTWWRHFDDRLGLSHGAQAALRELPWQPPPVLEKLLDDKPQHRIARPPSAADDPRHGFKMPVPELLYHHGELHNLSVSRGTLTAEERYKVNEHITQTIVMLDAMAFPDNLRRVPEYAGTHHETLTGTGYPRRLGAAELSVPARIMAVADIFEALTASDRPYKKSKTLSEAVEILWGFKRRGHIDPDVFDLFLTSGVYLRFAERFLSPELIDHVDIAPYLGASPPWRPYAAPAEAAPAT
jgi:HD-GYP domain-containing protein (c-di-GMP phosphodiesterase class II)